MASRKMDINRLGIVFVISGPSGVGKSSICKQILESDDNLHFSISCTTRDPHPGEIDGVNYNFISIADFNSRIEDGAFIEHANVHGNLYGTLHSEIDDFISKGQDVILEIDIQGALLIQQAAVVSDLKKSLHSVFIGPPTTSELENRLRGRGTETNDVVERRLEQATTELEHWQEYDSLIINANLNNAISQMQEIIASERLRVSRIKGSAPWE